MHIAIIGTGAVGSLYGGYLANAGANITLLDINQTHIDAINTNGLAIRKPDGESVVASVTATSDAKAVVPADVALIGVNSYDTASAAQIAKDILKPDGYAMTLQNGLGNVEVLVECLGRKSVVGGITYHGCTILQPGVVKHTVDGKTPLGELSSSDNARLMPLVGLLETAGLAPQPTNTIMNTIWSKFVHNCGVNALAAVSGLTPGQFQEVPEFDALQTILLEEAVALARANNITLDDADPIGTIKAWSKTRFHKPSMLQAVENGQQTEVESLNGYVVRESAKYQLSAPASKTITALTLGLQHRITKM